jgi:hypothetical protein
MLQNESISTKSVQYFTNIEVTANICDTEIMDPFRKLFIRILNKIHEMKAYNRYSVCSSVRQYV